MTDLLVPQEQRKEFKLILKRTAPSWLYVEPTTELQAHGLSPEILKEIVDEINKNALTNFNRNYNAKCNYLPIPPAVGMVFGFILMALDIAEHDSAKLIIGITMFLFCAVLAGITSVCAHRSYSRAMKCTMDNVLDHVEMSLNEQWQRCNGVRWFIAPEQLVTANRFHHWRQSAGFKGKISTRYNIGISCGEQNARSSMVAIGSPPLSRSVSKARSIRSQLRHKGKYMAVDEDDNIIMTVDSDSIEEELGSHMNLPDTSA